MTAGFEMAGKPPTMTREDAPVVMLVHGMWSRPHVWDNFRQFFEARGYRVITPTLRFHDTEPGDAPHPCLGETSLSDYLEGLVCEIGRLRTKPLVIGHSMGGLLAHILAARGFARAVVGLAPAQNAGVFNHDMRSAWIFRREFLRRGFWREPQLPSFEAMRYGVMNRLPERDREDLYSTLIQESGRVTLEIGFWFLDRQRTTWINPADVACPMLFMTGTEDKLTPLWLTHRLAEPYGEKLKVEALRGHSHWLPAEPGWERIAERAAAFFETEAPEMARRMAAQAAPGLRGLVTAYQAAR